MMTKKEKRINKKLSLIILALVFCFTSSADAETYYTVKNVSENTSSPMVLKGTETKYHNAATLTTWDFAGSSNIVYCITPGGAAPVNGKKYVKVDLGSNQATFDYICSKIKNAESYEKGAILKLAGVKYLGQEIANSKSAAYTEFFDGTSKYIGKSFSDTEVHNILDDASKATSDEANVTVSQNGNNITLVSNKVSVTVAVSGGYTITVNGSNKGTSTTLSPSSKATYTIKVVAASDTEDIKNAVVTITYDQTSAGKSSAVASYYLPSGATTTVQAGISCDYSGISNNCDTGFNEDGTTCKKQITVNEIGKKVTCKDPTVTTNTGKTGTGICDLNGNTVVAVQENFSSTTPTDDELYCIKKNSTEATELVYGQDNEYCKVYCTENIKLTLPGPDASNDAQTGNENVFVNAGSFFTIDGDMTQTNEVTCYSVFDYQTYQSNIYAFRESVVNAYNAYSKIAATKNASSKVPDPDTGLEVCQLTGSTSYKTLSIDPTTGSITSTTNTLSTANCDIDSTSVNSYKSALNTAISSAKTGIATEQTKWGECFDFKIDNVLTSIKSTCDTDIKFEYAESECGSYDLVIDTATSTEPTGNTGTLPAGHVNVGVCDVNGNNCNNNDTYNLVSYISLQSNVTIKYKFDNDFTVNLETGEVSCDAQTGNKYSEVYYGFPVKTSAIQAKYEYNYNYSGIGHDLSSNTCQTGRFDKIISENSFGCYFDVNSCKECLVRCTSSGCNEVIDECDGQCQTKCTGGGCIIDGNGGSLALYKTITLNNEFAYNIMTQNPTTTLALASMVSSTRSTKADGNFSNWSTAKGQDTEDEILDNGENIYAEEPEYKVILTPTTLEKIKTYNQTAGAYANAELECINYDAYNYGICTSKFIHEIFDDVFEIDTSKVEGLAKTNYNGIDFAIYTDTIEEFVGPAWK